MKKLIFLCSIISILLSGCQCQENLNIVDKNATKETKNLYRNLKKFANQGLMFGHQDATAYGMGWEYEPNRADVKDVTGDYPAIYGWDIGHIELGREKNLDDVNFDLMRKLIKEAYTRGGVNTISWHADNPVSNGDSWDITPSVKQVLPNGEEHEKFKIWLDRVAEFCLSLKGNKGELIPIIFRPYHEHTGSWFWWGEKLCSVEDYKQLWRFTVEYLRDTKNVHNLLYAFTPCGEMTREKYLERYPGDDYIDLLGYDNYRYKSDEDFIQKVTNAVKILNDISIEKNKLAAVTETGFEQIPERNWWTEILLKSIGTKNNILYVLVWRNGRPDHYYAPYKGHISSENFVEFYKHPEVLFQKDLTNLDIYK